MFKYFQLPSCCCWFWTGAWVGNENVAGKADGGDIIVCSLFISACDGGKFGLTNNWLATFDAKLSTELGSCWTFVCGNGCWLLITLVTVVASNGLLLIKLSTNADVTVGALNGLELENVFASGGTIGINGVGWLTDETTEGVWSFDTGATGGWLDCNNGAVGF